MKLFVHLPMALNPDARSALLISYGVGMTAKALVDTRRLETIDMVDISRDVVEMNRIVYPDPEELPTNDPRVTVHIEDGRYFLQTTRRRFDLITGEPPPPKMAGVVSLYTQEYFSLVRERLNPGGLTSYWLPVHSLNPDDSRAIIRAFCNAFEDCTLWAGSGLDWILLGSRDRDEPASAERMAMLWDDPVVGGELNRIGVERPEQLGALFMADAEELARIADGVAPLVDDWPKRLSDRVMPIETAAPTYYEWMETGPARERFAQSAWSRGVWPEVLRVETGPYFDVQAVINRTLVQGPPPLSRALPAAEEILDRWKLRTVPLWLLGSTSARLEAARRAASDGRSDPRILAELAVGALAEDRPGEAARLFAEAQSLDARHATWRTLEVFALLRAHRDEEARQRLATAPAAPGTGTGRVWLRRRLAGRATD
jgi:hypothetical protein